MKIGDIAKMAGVSNSAVSRYFNGGYISEEKKAMIRKVVEETGYQPSLQAQALRTKRTKIIGVILPRIDSSSMSRMVAGILSVLNENGYQMLLADTQNNTEKELEYLNMFSTKSVEGIIFIATIFGNKHKKLLKNLNAPVVVVGQRISGFSCVYHNDYQAMYDMTELVISKGNKNLGYLGVLEQDIAVGQQRYKGYCEALDDSKLSECKKNYEISDFSIESGRKAAERLLRKNKSIDAIMCATDRIAVGALDFIKEIGKRVPVDIAITGHGDSEISRVTSPRITTIHYDYEESAQAATKILLEMIENTKCSLKELKMGYHIVVNESV